MDNVTNRLLDAAKIARGGISDYALAKVLEVNQTTISHYRTGRSQMGEEVAVRIAELLGEKPGAVLAALAMERAKSDDTRRVWKDAVKRLGGIAATVALAIGAATLGVPSPAQANFTLPKLSPTGGQNMHCANRGKRRRRGPWSQLMELVR